MLHWTRQCFCLLQCHVKRGQIGTCLKKHATREKHQHLVCTLNVRTSSSNSNKDANKSVETADSKVSHDKDMNREKEVFPGQSPFLDSSSEYFKTVWSQSQAQGTRNQRQFEKTASASPTSTCPTKTEEDSDVFGSLLEETSQKLDQRHPNERLSEDIGEEPKDRDFRLGIPLTRYGRKGNTAIYYTKKMSQLGKQGRIRDAIYMFDEIMMKRDRVLPKKRTFITLIGILGRVGYTRKAFQLFRQMRMLGFDVDDHVYTSLFNACANSPSSADGLARAEKLIRHMQENKVKPNLFTVKSCMKALAVCGDFPRAYAVLDEAATRLELDSECFNALLFACIADKSSGFLRAMLVWQKMQEMQIQPEASTFNLLLRCIRDCGIGDPDKFQYLSSPGRPDHKPPSLQTGAQQYLFKESTLKTFQESSERSSHYKIETSRVTSDFSPKMSSSVDDGVTWWEEDHKSIRVSDSLKSKHTDLHLAEKDKAKKTKDVVHTQAASLTMKDLRKPEGRLVLLGGPAEFLQHMEGAGARPDLKTFTQLLACIPNNELSEVQLLGVMQQVGMSPDVDFLNDIMVRRYRRKEFDTIEKVLDTMSQLRLCPNMRTYAALALACNTKDKATQLLADMKNAGVEPTVDVLSHFIQASYSNYSYKLMVLKVIESLGYQPTTRMLTNIEKSIALSKSKIRQAEKEGDIDSYYLSEAFTIPLRNFLNYYKRWLQRTEMRRPEHPWKAFEPQDEEETKQDRPTVDGPSNDRNKGILSF